MNKIKLTIAFAICLFLIGNNFAQNTYPWPQNGNIGIGTSTPENTLHISNTGMTQLRL